MLAGAPVRRRRGDDSHPGDGCLRAREQLSPGTGKRDRGRGRVMDFSRFKLVTFDCYGTLIDWEAGIPPFVRPWLDHLPTTVPPDLVISAFALMQAKHQRVRPTLLYPEVLRRTWRDVE